MAELKAVKSSNVAQIGYFDNERELIVVFKNGGIYTYQDVPLSVFQELEEASSKGQYLNQSVKGIYAYEQINDEELNKKLARNVRTSPRRFIDYNEAVNYASELASKIAGASAFF